MKQNVTIRLKYSGPDVDNGTMSLEDVVPALQGLSGAYSKLAILEKIDYQYKLRVVGVESGSFDILFEIWNQLGQNSGQISAVGVLATGGTYIISKIMQLIKVVKHVKKEPYTERFTTNNNILIINSNKNELEIPLEVYNLFKQNYITSDLARIVKPLEENRINATEITTQTNKIKTSEKVVLAEKPYFDLEVVPVTKTDKIWLSGKFNSLTKSTNKGNFLLTDGTRVSYRFTSEKPELMYEHFAYNGPVKVECIAQLDENLKPISIEIFQVQRIQEELFSSSEKKGDFK